MMIRILALAFLIALAPPAAQADTNLVRDRIVEVLTDDGYEEIRISKTLLGRMRFVATKPRYRREIVVNPVTGVILRDYIRIITTNAGSGSSGGGGHAFDDDDDDDDRYDDDDDDDRDDYDDREDDDRSGSNSGSDRDDDRSGSNSGSGSDRDDDD